MIDNIVTLGSEIYFSELGNRACVTGGTGGCAVQRSQSGLDDRETIIMAMSHWFDPLFWGSRKSHNPARRKKGADWILFGFRNWNSLPPPAEQDAYTITFSEQWICIRSWLTFSGVRCGWSNG